MENEQQFELGRVQVIGIDCKIQVSVKNILLIVANFSALPAVYSATAVQV